MTFNPRWLILIPLLLFVLLFFKPNVSGDGYGYYLNAASFFEDFSPDVTGQLKICQYDISCPEIIKTVTGHSVVRWAFGFPLMTGPLFLTMLFLEKHIPIPFDATLVQRVGIPFFRNLALPLTTFLLFLLTLYVLPKILRKMHEHAQHTEKAPDPFLVIVIGIISFPIIWYVTYSPAYSHMAEAAMFTLVTYFFLKNKPLHAGVAVGIGTWIRYTSGAFILPFLLYYWFFQRDKKSTVQFLGGVIPFLISMALFFQMQFGTIFGSPYLNEFILDPPTMLINIFRIFFDFDRGMLFWTPLFLVAIYGLYKWNDPRRIPLLGCLVLGIITYSGFNAWDAGWGFGNRYFSVFLPLHVMGLYFLYTYDKWKKIIHVGAAYSLFIFFLFLGAAKSLSPDVWFFTRLLKYYFLEGHILELPGVLIDRIPILRVLRKDF